MTAGNSNTLSDPAYITIPGKCVATYTVSYALSKILIDLFTAVIYQYASQQ